MFPLLKDKEIDYVCEKMINIILEHCVFTPLHI